MQLTETQTKMLTRVLDQLMTNYTISVEELFATHAYVFGEESIAPFFTDTELFETILYLKETVIDNHLVDLTGLVSYYDNLQKQVGDYFEEAVFKRDQPFEIDAQHNLNQMAGSSSALITQPDMLAIQFSTNAGHLFEILYEQIIRFFESRPLPAAGETDLHSVVKRHVQELVSNNKPIALKWKLSLQNMLPDGIKHYLEQFASNYKGEQVFVMQFAKYLSHGQRVLIPAYEQFFSCSYNAVVWDYHHGCNPPDYSAIINIVKREEPITDEAFKLQLTEWLIYSKLVISHREHCEMVEDYRPDQLANYFDHLFHGTSIRVYGGGDMHYWIHNLFEERLSLKKWSILKRPPGHFWLTSDNPGFMINIRELEEGFTEVTPRHSLLEVRPDSVLYYPLSKDYCLKLEPKVDVIEEVKENIPIAYEAPSEGEIEFVNGVTLSTYKKVVITNQRNTIKQYS